MEVLELTSVMGIHTCNVSIPILVNELSKQGIEQETKLTKKKQLLKEKFIRERGYWAELWNDLLVLDEDFFESYLNFSAVPWKKGSLSPKIKEFIYIAFDVAVTHLFKPGTEFHIENTFKYGATKEEIMEVFQLVSTIGIHTCTMSVPILRSALEKLNTK